MDDRPSSSEVDDTDKDPDYEVEEDPDYDPSRDWPHATGEDWENLAEHLRQGGLTNHAWLLAIDQLPLTVWLTNFRSRVITKVDKFDSDQNKESYPM